MTTTFQTLLLSASLLGVDPRPIVPPAAAPRGPVKEILRLQLSKIVRSQERAWVFQPAGSGNPGFCAALDPKADLWIKLREHDQNAAHPLSAYEAGVEEDFPSGRLRIVLENGVLRAFPVDPPQTPQARAAVPDLLRGLFDAAEHVLFTPVEYAVVYEDGGQVPSSLSLIREDQSGRFWVSYHSKAELAEIAWFVGINGTLYGMKLEGDDLVFYSEPAPSASAE